MNIKEVMKRIGSNKKVILLFLVLWACISYTIFLDYNEEWASGRSVPKYGITYDKLEISEDEKLFLAEGVTVSQSIKIAEGDFAGISLWFDSETDIMQGRILIELRKKDGNVLIGKWDQDISDIPIGVFSDYWLKDRIFVEKDEEYIINISAKKIEDNNITVALTKSHNDVALIVGNQISDSDIAVRTIVGDHDAIKYIIMFQYILMSIVLIVVVFMIISSRKLEWIFAITTIIIGTMYSIALPPNSVPDESSHFVTAYAQSSIILGEKAFNEEGIVIVDNARLWGAGETVPKVGTYDKYLRGVLGEDIDSTETETLTRTPLEMKHPGYFPQVIGITIGRVLDLNCEQLYYIGRAFALIWYVFLMYWAIKIIPFGKMAFYTIATLPMTMQMVMSYNYDSTLFGFCFFLFSYLLYLIYEKNKVDYKDVIILSLLTVSIASIKFIYLPILGLGLFIPKEKFSGMKNKILSIIWLGSLSIVTLLYLKLPMLLSLGTERTTFSTNPGKAITISYCLEYPLTIFNIFFRTIEEFLNVYIGQMIVTPMGWLEIHLTTTLVGAFLFILVTSLLCDKSNKKIIVTSKLKIVSFLCCGAMMFLALSALLFDCTNEGSRVISGFQGRYWIPAIPMFIVFLQNNSFICKKTINKYLLLFMMYLHCFTVSCIGTIIVSR